MIKNIIGKRNVPFWLRQKVVSLNKFGREPLAEGEGRRRKKPTPYFLAPKTKFVSGAGGGI